MSNHTPGPWRACDDDGTGTLPCVLANQVTSYGNFYVAQCNVYDDARFIAAAPDMYVALKRLTECIAASKLTIYEMRDACALLARIDEVKS